MRVLECALNGTCLDGKCAQWNRRSGTRLDCVQPSCKLDSLNDADDLPAILRNDVRRFGADIALTSSGGRRSGARLASHGGAVAVKVLGGSSAVAEQQARRIR